jgi:hypothetical protein
MIAKNKNQITKDNLYSFKNIGVSVPTLNECHILLKESIKLGYTHTFGDLDYARRDEPCVLLWAEKLRLATISFQLEEGFIILSFEEYMSILEN